MAYLPVVSRVTVDQTFLADLYFRLGTVNADLSLLNPTPFSPLNLHSPTIRFLRDIFDRAKNAFVEYRVIFESKNLLIYQQLL